MFEDFYVQRRIRRFRKDINVLQKGSVSVKMLVGEKYIGVYEKLWDIIKTYDESKKAVLDITFVSEEYISFIYKTANKCCALNYSFDSGFFEREQVLLKKMGLSEKYIKKTLKNNSIKSVKLFLHMFLFQGGVGIICDNMGEKVIKIRL